MTIRMSSSDYDTGVADGSQRAVDDVLDVIDEHIPSLSDDNETEIVDLIARSPWEDFDVADYAIRTCSCGDRIDGFYEYVDHLKSAIKRALVV